MQRPLAGVRRFGGGLAILILALAAPATRADDDSLEHGAKRAGHAAGSLVREIGQDAKKAGKAVGKAAKEGGKEFKRAVKGER